MIVNVVTTVATTSVRKYSCILYVHIVTWENMPGAVDSPSLNFHFDTGVMLKLKVKSRWPFQQFTAMLSLCIFWHLRAMAFLNSDIEDHTFYFLQPK